MRAGKRVSSEVSPLRTGREPKKKKNPLASVSLSPKAFLSAPSRLYFPLPSPLACSSLSPGPIPSPLASLTLTSRLTDASLSPHSREPLASLTRLDSQKGATVVADGSEEEEEEDIDFEEDDEEDMLEHYLAEKTAGGSTK